MATEMDRAYCDWPQHDEISSQSSYQGASRSELLDHGSVSFGRFAVETLSWEKWSVFTHNRCKEELEKFKAPGLVAQKKAYFEEYYRKIRALKALQSKEDSGCNSSVSSEYTDNTQTITQQSPECTKEEKECSILSDECHGHNAQKLVDDISITDQVRCPSPDYSTSFSNQQTKEDAKRVYDKLNFVTVVSSDVSSPERSYNNETAEDIFQKTHIMDSEIKEVSVASEVCGTISKELNHVEVDILQKESYGSVDFELDDNKKEHPTLSSRSGTSLPRTRADTGRSPQRLRLTEHGSSNNGSSLSKIGNGGKSDSKRPASVFANNPKAIAATSTKNGVTTNATRTSDEIRSPQKLRDPLPGKTCKMKQANFTPNAALYLCSNGAKNSASQSISSSTKNTGSTTNRNSVSTTVLPSRPTTTLRANTTINHPLSASTQRHASSRDGGILGGKNTSRYLCSNGVKNSASQSISSSTRNNGSTTNRNTVSTTVLPSRPSTTLRANITINRPLSASTQRHASSRNGGILGGKNTSRYTEKASLKSLSSAQSTSKIAVTGGMMDVTSLARRIEDGSKKPMALDRGKGILKSSGREGSGVKSMPTKSLDHNFQQGSLVRSSSKRNAQEEGGGETWMKNQATTRHLAASHHPSYMNAKNSRKISSQSVDLTRNARKPWS